MIPYAEAFKRAMDSVPNPRVEEVPLLKSRGRLLAAEIIALEDLPPFQRSPLDGYAFKAADTQGASKIKPAALEIIGSIAAGVQFLQEVKEGQAVRIMTGAPIPSGADCVIRQENVVQCGSRVLVFEELRKGDNVVQKGEDVPKGLPLFSPGRRLVSSDIGLLAALGYAMVPVYSPPRVNILSTGGELVPVSEAPGPGKIRNSNSYLLASLVEEYGGSPFLQGIADDNLQEICAALENMLKESDIILTTGGVSVGEYDLLPEALERLGATQIFWKVALKPGTPLLAAKIRGKLIFALSGNPAACLVTFDQFVGPALFKMQGIKNFSLPVSNAVLQDDLVVKQSAQLRFVRAFCSLNANNILEVSSAGSQRPGVLSSFRNFNSYILLQNGVKPPRRGAEVPVQLLPRLFSQEPERGMYLASRMAALPEKGKRFIPSTLEHDYFNRLTQTGG